MLRWKQIELVIISWPETEKIHSTGEKVDRRMQNVECGALGLLQLVFLDIKFGK